MHLKTTTWGRIHREKSDNNFMPPHRVIPNPEKGLIYSLSIVIKLEHFNLQPENTPLEKVHIDI